MLLFFEEKELIVTATKHTQTLQDAPAIASVITADEIRQMGARDLMDVLKRIPGFGVTKGYYGKEEIEVRGLKTTNSEKVKLLIDGHSVNDNLSGGAMWGFDSLTLDNVKRIEIIRGPGSALYGSNAFSAVINVITKDGKDIDGAIVTGDLGNFDTQKANLQAGKRYNDLETAFALDYYHTDGARLMIDKDLMGNSGYTKDFEDKIDGSLKATWNDLTFSSKYIKRSRGVYLGASYVINDESENNTEQFFVELSYKHSFSDETKLIAKLYYDQLNWKTLWELYPEGTPGFPDGMLGEPSVNEHTYGGELQLDQELFKDNTFTLGAIAEKRGQKVGHLANFDPVTFSPLPSTALQDVVSWNKGTSRDIFAAYAQDIWNLQKDLSLTLGLRNDQYSDFGGAANPRGALVWKFKDNWDMKLLYGEAFRAPSFEELYNINNPVVLGNEDLKAEKMKTYEASLGFTSNHHYTSRLSYFNNVFTDNIRLVEQTTAGTYKFENFGGANIQGIEYEMKREFDKDAYYYINYTWQDAKDKDTNQRIQDVPMHKGNIGGNIKLFMYLYANANVFVSGERTRAAGDTRDPLPAYALVDLTLIAKDFYKGLELRGMVHNLLDKQYSDPAPAGTLTNDFPRESKDFRNRQLHPGKKGNGRGFFEEGSIFRDYREVGRL
ncbi:MAG: TonB-dependent receptor [Deltaproteobacteria bacterium]|nr:TonB-dependent receptor [Deltaproteobacteria bacterium]